MEIDEIGAAAIIIKMPSVEFVVRRELVMSRTYGVSVLGVVSLLHMVLDQPSAR